MRQRLSLALVSCLGISFLASGANRLWGEDWAQWRGPHRAGRSLESGLLDAWPEEGPKIAWQASGLGTGYASVVIADDTLYTCGDQDGKAMLIAMGMKQHEVLWSAPLGDGWGDGSRSTPTIAGDSIIALNAHGLLSCVSRSDGSVRWTKNLSSDFGGQMMSGWGYSESPLVDGDRVICTPGSKSAALACLALATGETMWQTAIDDCDGAAYASPVIMDVHGTRTYVTVLGKAVGCVGVDATTGQLRWRNNEVAGGVANVPTPVVDGDTVFYSTGYQDGGSALLKIQQDGDKFEAQTVYLKEANKLRNHHGGVIQVGKYLYGGHGQNEGFPFCIEMASGESKWELTRGPGGGSAAITFADGLLYFYYEDGTVALIRATPDELKVVSHFEIPDRSGSPCWAHPVIYKGQLLLRDQDRLLAYAIGQ
jgi:outer membrane protein assembly factor BamB